MLDIFFILLASFTFGIIRTKQHFLLIYSFFKLQSILTTETKIFADFIILTFFNKVTN